MTCQPYMSQSPLWKIRNRGGLCILVAALAAGWSGAASAQATYDDHPLRDRLRLNLGGFKTDETNSSVRLDSSTLGIGTIVDLEDKLNVEDSATVFRLDGHYRFNRAHRIEWSWYNIDRDGRATLEEDIQIGDEVYEVGLSLDTEVKTNIIKVNYAWSFINVEKYEFFLGVGLNIRDTTFSFKGENAEQAAEFEDGGTIPLPTIAFGGRYNINPRTAILFRSENLNVDVKGYKGRFQDTYILMEYDFTNHFGMGGGINVFNFSASGEVDDNLEGEVESSYRGFLLYVKYQL